MMLVSYNKIYEILHVKKYLEFYSASGYFRTEVIEMCVFGAVIEIIILAQTNRSLRVTS